MNYRNLAFTVDFFWSNYFYSIIFLLIIPFFFSYLFTSKSKLPSDISWLFGIIILSILIILLHAHGLSKNLTFIIIYILSIAGFVSFIKNMNKFNFRMNILSLKSLVYFISFIFAFDALLVTYFEPIVAGDSLAYWWSKTKALYQWQPLNLFLSPQYPHLGSTIWMLAINYADGNEFVGRGLFATLQAIIFISFCFALNLKNLDLASRIVYGGIVVLAYIFLVKLEMGGGHTFTYSGYMDWLVAIIPCFGYFLFGYRNILQNKSEKYRLHVDNIILIVFFSSAALVKAEGYTDILIYLVSISLCFVFFTNKKTEIKNIVPVIISFFIIFIIININNYIYLINGISIGNTHGFNLKSILLSYQNIDRTPLIIEYLIKSTLNNSWVYITYMILLIGIIIIKRFDLLVLSLLPILLYYFFIYLVFLSTTSPIEWHLSTTLFRLNYHIIIMMIFSNIIFIKFLLNKYNLRNK